MCGIVAVVTKRPSYSFNKQETDLFKYMLLVDSLRGQDSTGVFGVERNGNVSIVKSAEHSGTFIGTTEFDAFSTKMIRSGWCMVGHNRAATRGIVNDKNAHPFWKDDKVVLVHNGTFVGDHKKHADTEVDSEALAHLLADHDPNTSGIKEVFEKIDAAYSTMWYDTRSKELHFLRNLQRPMCFVETDNLWVMASEPEFIEFALAKAKVNPIDDVKLLKHDYLLKFSVTNDNKLKVNGEEFTPKKVYQVPKVTTTVTTPVKVETKIDHNKIEKDANVEKLKGALALIKSNNDLDAAPTTQVTPVSDAIDKVVCELKKEDDTPFMLKSAEFFRQRALYQQGTPGYFTPKDIIPHNGKYILFGPMADDPAVTGVVVIDEKEYPELIDTTNHPIVEGTISMNSFRNQVAACDPNDMEGFGFIHMVNPRKSEIHYHA